MAPVTEASPERRQVRPRPVGEALAGARPRVRPRSPGSGGWPGVSQTQVGRRGQGRGLTRAALELLCQVQSHGVFLLPVPSAFRRGGDQAFPGLLWDVICAHLILFRMPQLSSWGARSVRTAGSPPCLHLRHPPELALALPVLPLAPAILCAGLQLLQVSTPLSPARTLCLPTACPGLTARARARATPPPAQVRLVGLNPPHAPSGPSKELFPLRFFPVLPPSPVRSG